MYGATYTACTSCYLGRLRDFLMLFFHSITERKAEEEHISALQNQIEVRFQSLTVLVYTRIPWSRHVLKTTHE